MNEITKKRSTSLAQTLAIQTQIHLPGTVGRLLKQIRELEQIAPRCLVADAVRNTPLAMGATQAGPVFWRDYYQSRNHLRYVLDRHSVIGIVGWAIRETAIVGAGLRRGRPGLTKTRMVLRGARDAARNEMGRTVEPGSI